MHIEAKSVLLGAVELLALGLLLGCGGPSPATPVAVPTTAPTAVPTAAGVGEEPTAVSTGEATATPEPAAPATEAAPTLAALDPEALLQERCSTCHGLERVTSVTKSADDWRKTVVRMVAKGASLSDAEIEALVEYLAQKYAK